MLQLLQVFSEAIGVELDQGVFFLFQIGSLLLAYVYRHCLPPPRGGATVKQTCYWRHLSAAVLGLIMLIGVFGWSTVHIILQALGVYLIMYLMPHSIQHKVAFVFSMGYLICIQIERLVNVDSRYTFEISYPMMLTTQKLTGLVFSYSDSSKNKDKLSPFQLKYVIHKLPSPVEFTGYIFHFAGLIVGPVVFYTDYIQFIEGSNLDPNENTVNQNNHSVSNGCNGDKKHNELPPSPTPEVRKKVAIALFCLVIHLVTSKRFPTEANGDPDFIASHGFLYRFMYLNLSMPLGRYRYYFAWVFGEAVQNAAGLGLHYVDSLPRWDLTTNVHILNIDTADSLKLYADNWNIFTTKWLRLVSYERVTSNKLLVTYVLNAVWHGIEPGYYFSFLGLAFFTVAARKMRRKVRPVFVDTKWKKSYDLVTMVVTHLAVYYIMGGFHVLHWKQTISFYHSSMYWWMHIAVLLVILIPFPTLKEKLK